MCRAGLLGLVDIRNQYIEIYVVCQKLRSYNRFYEGWESYKRGI